MNNIAELKAELHQINDSIATINVTLDAFGEDEELSRQLQKLVEARGNHSKIECYPLGV
ncbi:hypothetical protein [Paenibacillus sp. OV219]|uniref:hypothetical protein n=1 Tax=Paenibacillus sp. OV219 TaxID=1884377 RepID=UPI0008C02F42|nr:hypothetical protein [Paenibacillus sp. OV219]SEP18652.1 hypothetical protein SAMN05518847_1285 [Paenibacillus sp. OV219]